jgi:hypothetical protein
MLCRLCLYSVPLTLVKYMQQQLHAYTSTLLHMKACGKALVTVHVCVCCARVLSKPCCRTLWCVAVMVSIKCVCVAQV